MVEKHSVEALRPEETTLQMNDIWIKTDEGNGPHDICRVIGASRSPSPDPARSRNCDILLRNDTNTARVALAR